MRIFLILLFAFQTNALSNRLVPTKLCKDCKYFIAHKKECALFIENTDLIYGNNDYNYANTVRKNEDKCGEEAKYFEENTNKIVTVPYYFILKAATYWRVTPVLLLFFIYADVVYKLTHYAN